MLSVSGQVVQYLNTDEKDSYDIASKSELTKRVKKLTSGVKKDKIFDRIKQKTGADVLQLIEAKTPRWGGVVRTMVRAVLMAPTKPQLDNAVADLWSLLTELKAHAFQEYLVKGYFGTDKSKRLLWFYIGAVCNGIFNFFFILFLLYFLKFFL